MKKPKICMITMFKNEAHSIKNMLESVAPHISFWVIQNNGSTDGTPEVVKEWADRTGIPGILYEVEEGWVNFGWNRDHLLQKTLQSDHGCDWIMKMDCDETLVVDDDFDWSPFNNIDMQSFNVTATAPGIIYLRTWIWNSKLPWKFNHDPAHETIYLDDGVTNENYQTFTLDKKFRMNAGAVHGESYTVPTKYISDALKLEEKLLREQTMLTDLYHFWYIGKSYEDCYRGNFFPLKELHQEEYAKRCMFYFKEVVNHSHKSYRETGTPERWDEMAYYAMCAVGNAHRFLKQYEKAIEYYNRAEPFFPIRNDHLMYLAEIHWELRDYKRMHHYTSIMMQPERTCPFPNAVFLISPGMYHDGGGYPEHLHKVSIDGMTNTQEESVFAVNRYSQKKRFWVVDNFYDDPYLVRNYAMQQEYEVSSDWYKGRRTFKQYLFPQLKPKFEEVMGIKIRQWETYPMNGRFQFCIPEDRLVYHYDSQTWAAMIYLTPNAPPSTGTSFYAHKGTNIRHIEEHPEADNCFSGGFYDSTKFELVDTIGNVFNRLVIFDARLFHAASGYFGQNIQDSRLFQIFFFD